MFLKLRKTLACLFDYGLFYFVTVFVSLILPIELDRQLFFLWALMVPLAWALVEMCCFKLYQSTPGKKLFGLSLPPLTWKESFKRAFLFKRSRDLIVKTIGFKRYMIALMLASSAGSALFFGGDIAEAAIHYEQRLTTGGWVEYISDNGKFQVHFPKKPQQTFQTFDVSDGEPLNLNEYTAQQEAEFSVSYLDLPKKWRLFSSNTLLKGAMKVVLEHMPNAELIDQQLVKYKHYPAMDFRLKEEGNIIEGRLILVGNTLYKLWVVYFPDTPREQQHETFLGSFKLN